MIATPILTSLLFRYGGEKWKAVRRFGIPLIVVLTAFLGHCQWILAILSAVLVCGVLHLGYGDKLREASGEWYHFLLYYLGFLYGCSLLPLYISENLLVIGIGMAGAMSAVFGSLMYASHKFNSFDHKYVEFGTGLALGIAAELPFLL